MILNSSYVKKLTSYEKNGTLPFPLSLSAVCSLYSYFRSYRSMPLFYNFGTLGALLSAFRILKLIILYNTLFIYCPVLGC